MTFDQHPGRNCATRDTSEWFPPRASIAAVRAATKLCRGCPVIEDCLRFAIKAEWGTAKSGRDGIYGGTTPAERFALEERIRGGKVKPTINHGTESGAKMHRRRGEKPCADRLEGERQASRRRSERVA